MRLTLLAQKPLTQVVAAAGLLVALRGLAVLAVAAAGLLVLGK